MLRDQRTMVGHRRHETPAEVRLAWEEWATAYGFRIRQRFGNYSTDLRESPRRIAAYVSGGAWTADCPSCNGGVPTWPGGNDLGCCLDCGTVYPIVYPPQAELDRAVAALELRPRENQHWFPQRGETADDLEAENRQRGYLVGEPDSPDEALTAGLKLMLGDAAAAARAVAVLKREGIVA